MVCRRHRFCDPDTPFLFCRRLGVPEFFFLGIWGVGPLRGELQCSPWLRWAVLGPTTSPMPSNAATTMVSPHGLLPEDLTRWRRGARWHEKSQLQLPLQANPTFTMTLTNGTPNNCKISFSARSPDNCVNFFHGFAWGFHIEKSQKFLACKILDKNSK